MANVVLVQKAFGKWIMCVEFTVLNLACSMNPYLLANIDRLIDESLEYKTPCFMDVHLGYNQIKMDPRMRAKAMFMSNNYNYYYEVTPLRLKNVDAIYQRRMVIVFFNQIGHNLEIYINDMVAKILEEENRSGDR